MRLAELVDTPPALIWSLGARAQTRWGTDAGVPDAERAFALASTRTTPSSAAGPQYSSATAWSRRDGTPRRPRTGSAYRTLRDAGEFDYAASVGAITARWDFALGRWHKARPLVRDLLTIARSDDCAATSRCVAALMCAYEGRSAAALMHLRRAEELANSSPVGEPLIDTQIQVSLATGGPQWRLGEDLRTHGRRRPRQSRRRRRVAYVRVPGCSPIRRSARGQSRA